MTGRDLIIYIMENHLEDDPVFQSGKFIGFRPAIEVAVKYGVGVETIKAWYELGELKGIKIGDEVYILENVKHARMKLEV